MPGGQTKVRHYTPKNTKRDWRELSLKLDYDVVTERRGPIFERAPPWSLEFGGSVLEVVRLALAMAVG
jgi:hypothetical protein